MKVLNEKKKRALRTRAASLDSLAMLAVMCLLQVGLRKLGLSDLQVIMALFPLGLVLSWWLTNLPIAKRCLPQLHRANRVLVAELKWERKKPDRFTGVVPEPYWWAKYN